VFTTVQISPLSYDILQDTGADHDEQQHPVQRLIAEVTQIAHDAFHHVAIARIRRIAADRNLLGPHGHADLGPRAELLFEKHGYLRIERRTLQRDASRRRS